MYHPKRALNVGENVVVTVLLFKVNIKGVRKMARDIVIVSLM